MQNVKGYILAVALFLVDYRAGNMAAASALESAHRAIGQPDSGADRKPALSGGGKKWRTLQTPRSHRGRMKNENENENANVNVNVNVNTNEMGRIKKPLGRLPKPQGQQVSGRLPKIGQLDSRLSEIGKSNDRLPKMGQPRDRPEINGDAEMAQDSHNMSWPKIESLKTEAINCSQPHNEDDRYSSSFNVNSSLIALNVSDDFQVTGEEGPKQSSSVHVGEDITLCWIETTTIKEDHSVHPVQRLVIREYTISFENSATIPDRYLECLKIEGEVDGKNSSVPTSALFEVIDENTHHSRVVNFTTVSHSDTLTVWQHKRVRCGVGPVVTKTVIEWPDDKWTRSSNNPKKRVEIKVSPKTHKLTAYPTDDEPCTTDITDSELNFTTPVNFSPPVDCGPGITCDDDCVGEDCKQSTVTNKGSEISVFDDEITPSYITTTDAEKEIDRITHTTADYESTEPSSTPATKGPPSVTDEMIDSSEEITTPDFSTTMQTKEDDSSYSERPMEQTTIGDNETWTEITVFETSSPTASSTVLSVTMTNEPVTSIETGNQELEVTDSSEESSSGTSEMEESCESGESCTDYSSESSITSSEEFSTSEVDNIDTTTPRDGKTAYVEEFSTTPTTDASAVQTSKSTTQDDSDYSSTEEWEASTQTTQSQSNITVTKTIESTDTTSDVTESSFTTTELHSDESTETSMNVNQTDPTESIFGTTTMLTTMTTSVGSIVTTLKSVTNVQVPEDMSTTGSDLTVASTTKISTTGDGDIEEDITNETLITDSTSQASITEATTTEKVPPESCENNESCDSSSENENNNIDVPGGSSVEECDNENGTVTCRPSSDKPENSTEIVDTTTSDLTEMTMTMTTELDLTTSDGQSTASRSESTVEEATIDVSGSSVEVTTPTVEMNRTDVTEMTIPMTTATELSTSYGLSTTPRGDTTVQDTTVNGSSSYEEVTTPTITVDSNQTTTEETTTEKSSSTTCENSESCDSSSENENVNVIVPGDSSTEGCDSENGTETCTSTSARPGGTSEMIDMNTTDVTPMTITMTTETELPTSYGLSTTPRGDTTVQDTTVNVSSSYEEVTTPTITVDSNQTTTQETTTEKHTSTTCESSESCDSSSENDNVNVIVPGDSSMEGCDSENGTETCTSTSARPGGTSEMIDMNTTDVTPTTITMTTETELPTSYGLSTTPRGDTTVQDTTVDVSSSYKEEVTTPVTKVDSETTTAETTTEKHTSTTCESSESCDLSSENENANVIVPGDSSTEGCDSENGTVTCVPTSARPGGTTEIGDMNTTDVTQTTNTMTTATELPTSYGLSTTPRSDTTVQETTVNVSSSYEEVTTPTITVDSEATTEETTTEKHTSTTCENSESCDSSSENENVNVIVPGDSSTEGCDSENGTETCRSTSARPGGTSEMIDMNTTDVTEMITPMTTETKLSTSYGLSTTPRADTTVQETTVDVSSSYEEVTTPTITVDSNQTTTEETTTEKHTSTTCESSESCDSSSENENANVIVPGDSSTEGCDSENGTVTCVPTSARPGYTSEMIDMNTTDVTPTKITMTTETELPTSYGLSTTPRGDATVQETTVDASSSYEEVTTPTITVDTNQTTTEETTTKESSSTTCENNESCDLSSENENENIIVPGDSSVEECDNENGTVTCRPTSASPGGTTEIVEMTATEIDLSTRSNVTISESTTAHGEITTVETTTDFSGFRNATVTEETTTDISYATTEETTSSNTTEGDDTTKESTTGVSDATTEVTLVLTTSGDKTTEVSTINIGTTTGMTTSATVLDGEKTTEARTTRSSDAVIDITASSTTEYDHSEFIDSSTEGSTQTSSQLHSEQSTMEIGDVTTETTSNTTDHDVEETTGTVLHISKSTTDEVTGTVFTTTDASTDMFTPTVGNDSVKTTMETVTITGDEETTSDYSTVPSTQAGATTEEPGNTTISCDPSTGECDTTETVDVIPTTPILCDPELGSCDTEDGNGTTVSSCDKESGDCSTDLSSSSEIPCDAESGDCPVGSSPIPTTVCDEGSGSSCIITSESPQYSTTIDASETCDDRPMGNCTIPPRGEDITDLPATTSSTPVEVENISTTVSDVPTTVDNRRTTTVTATSKDPNANHKLALTIKILLEHIDGNQKKQKLYEIEKHLLFDEHPEDQGNQSLMKQVKSLNNAVSMQTVEALFNCSSVEKLTGDVGDFAAKYLEMQNKIRRIHGSSSNSTTSEGSQLHKSQNPNHLAKPKVDPNLKMILPGIHADIHSGLSHVMTRVSSENEVKQQASGLNDEDNPPSRILKVVADPRDKRVHGRRKRQTLEGLTIAEQDLPKDVEEVGHWSNERVRRAINGGHVRSLTEFTIYKGP